MRKKSPEMALRMIEAARILLLEKGAKGTTMEAIAARAGIAKGTLYAYFPDKDAILLALIEDLAEAKTDAFAEAFIEEGAIATRVGRGLAAMFGIVADLLEGSAFAFELIGEHKRLSTRLEAADAAITETIIAEMTAAGIGDAEKIVSVLMAACSGLVMKFPRPRNVREGIVLLCERMVR
ncbi:TetR/AcrR family transcriptional regulator [Pelagibacterium limicola]|uniref:TetR/AcrR family transcriptional regulator n=1 Tax=Pelagibacterium limicola TaxID=2791022 RepID=UPI0018AFA9D4|nr:TetR/AcrR family transcriptional regulator [Pelagibacterium limicola]